MLLLGAYCLVDSGVGLRREDASHAVVVYSIRYLPTVWQQPLI